MTSGIINNNIHNFDEIEFIISIIFAVIVITILDGLKKVKLTQFKNRK